MAPKPASPAEWAGRWEALREYLDDTAAECEAGSLAATDETLHASRAGRALASRATLRKMRELEAGQ